MLSTFYYFYVMNVKDKNSLLKNVYISSDKDLSESSVLSVMSVIQNH